LPSLRERVDDIFILSEYVLKQLAKKNNVVKPTLSKAALNALQDYHFPGNIRELENILERALTWFDGGLIEVEDLMLPKSQQYETVVILNQSRELKLEDDLESQLEDQERQLITQALEATRWNKTAAAKKLGITFRALRYKLKKLNLE
jgi:two-component system response regulator PilR (NtrC family)